MLYYQTISPGLRDVLNKLMQLNELALFRLVGGTSLALQIGHRKSIDIDLFSNHAFDNKVLQGVLQKTFNDFSITWANQNGFTCIINDIKTDIFNWNTSFILPAYQEDTLRLMHKEEIAAMKFEAVTNRKEKKDFYDIAFLLQEYTLQHLLTLFSKKYPFLDRKMVIESLASVHFADSSLDPILFKEMEWATAKNIILNTVELYYEEQISNKKKLQEERLRNAEQLLKQKKKKNE
ncbi:MAG: nucleotidyl transferase AbiEii/AbiGii toxin family protein [Bacteroidota bacterium]|nr:nucleotidyl transferase AbiEii/AbiGii toxin family protein [Bacteroidota bacterium]